MDSTLSPLVEYYSDFKAAIFTSSLTLGTFLFTMKTFVIQTMKREVYDNPKYQMKVYERIKAGSKKDSYYGQLLNFKRLLFWTIIVSFCNALIQLTLGFFHFTATVIICFITTGISWALAIWALVLVSKNLTLMIKNSEKSVNLQK